MRLKTRCLGFFGGHFQAQQDLKKVNKEWNVSSEDVLFWKCLPLSRSSSYLLIFSWTCCLSCSVPGVCHNMLCLVIGSIFPPDPHISWCQMLGGSEHSCAIILSMLGPAPSILGVYSLTSASSLRNPISFISDLEITTISVIPFFSRFLFEVTDGIKEDRRSNFFFCLSFKCFSIK